MKHLSKDDIQKMINTCEKPEEFIKDEDLRRMFRCENEIVRTKCKAKKYLDIVEDSLRFQANPQLLDDEARCDDFLSKLTAEFEEEYKNITTTDPDEVSSQRRQLLERVQIEYTRKLGEEERYKKFKEKLNKAYQGKIKIEKNP